MAHKYYLLDKKHSFGVVFYGLDPTAPSGQDITMVYSNTSIEKT